MKKLFWIAAFFMTLSLGLIIFVFFFAKETDGRLKLAILTIGYLLFFLFGSMFMATLLEIIQPYKFLIGKRVDMDECIVRKETNIVSINNLCDEISKKGYVLEELSCEMGNIKIFQQIEHRKRRTIVNYIIIMDYFPDITSHQFVIVEELINSATLKSEKKENLKGLIHRRYILCTFSNNVSDDNIKKFIFSANFATMIYLPLIVDTESKVVYHASILLKYDSGKVLEELTQRVSSIFYK
ncbi:hypothetical protein LI031_24485 [Enterocloster citroniae]|uniref:hypothetical protein n=3 Tax=Enterocloster citroniae TaxID=358743 RepID=UPI001D07F134|nr:hypothetical protein [Enterocloster citroniae]MCB7067023.1 hypothetical protein [Enterocloster citroniae]